MRKREFSDVLARVMWWRGTRSTPFATMSPSDYRCCVACRCCRIEARLILQFAIEHP